MKVSPGCDEVREIVRQTFGDFTGEIVGDDLLSESILIRDGKYRGRSYRAVNLMAMWFVELGFVQVYDHDGTMLRMINLFEEQQAVRRAA
jgi:hypothetical protein